MTSVRYYPLPAPIIQVRGTGTRARLAETEPSLIQTAETPGHQGARGKVSGILKRKGSNNLKMTTVESVTNSDALKKSADTVAKAAFNKTDKGDFCSVNDPIRSKAIFSEP